MQLLHFLKACVLLTRDFDAPNTVGSHHSIRQPICTPTIRLPKALCLIGVKSVNYLNSLGEPAVWSRSTYNEVWFLHAARMHGQSFYLSASLLASTTSGPEDSAAYTLLMQSYQDDMDEEGEGEDEGLASQAQATPTDPSNTNIGALGQETLSAPPAPTRASAVRRRCRKLWQNLPKWQK